MKALHTILLAAVVGVGLTGCQPTICERSETADSKVGSACAIPPLLGSTCTASIKSCSEADQKVIGDVVTCIDGLPECTPLARDAWLLQREGCTGSLSSLSQPCKDAVFMGMLPGEDAGVPDAGVPAMVDGGQGIDLYATANENTVGIAWVPRQQGDVARWILVETDTLGDNRTEREIATGNAINFTVEDAGQAGRTYFVFGLNQMNEIVQGAPFAVEMEDAGVPMCTGPASCPSNQVCDLGTCKTQTCVAGGTNTCPVGYGCNAQGFCLQLTADGGFVIGGGMRDAGVTPLPFITNPVTITPRPPMVQPAVQVGLVAGRRPDVVGIDSARVALALEQEGQVIAHTSTQRGHDFIDDSLTAAGIDTLGGNVHLAWNAESRLLYACYVVGRGIRVQVSKDQGRTWGRVARTFEPPASEDGGISENFRDCDIAAWKNGGALLVNAEPETLMLYDLAPDLTTNMRGPAFTSVFDAGVNSVTFPSRPAIATAPELGIVHVSFTGTRELFNGGADQEPYVVSREGSGPFSAATRMTPAASASALPEDFTTIAVHPKTGRAIGAYTTVQVGSQNSTVYVSLNNPQTRTWSTGAHLNVFVVDQNTSVWLPNKPAAETWFAFSPSFAPMADGRFAFSFVAGPRVGGVGDYRMYMVPFDLDRVPSITAGRGWFVPPVMQMSTDRVIDPRGSTNGPQPPVSSISTDGQVSVYGAFTVGTGVNGDVEGTARYWHWP